MARRRTIHRCTQCGGTEAKWSGRCGACGAWNSLVEEVEEVGRGGKGLVGLAPSTPPIPIAEVDPASGQPQSTGIGELDRVLVVGLVPGSVTLVGGEPGVGKSTLLLQFVAQWHGTVLYVSAEESAQQVRMRADRLGALREGLWLLAETDLTATLAAIAEVSPSLVVIDSIQTVADPELSSAPGSVVQVRECAHRLVQEAKRRGIVVVIVGHVTKDGGLAGPRVLEHVVDTVLAFEGERHHALRLLRATKHRFGPTSELGLFEMSGDGLIDVPDPSGLFLADRRPGTPGSVVVPALEGQRPLMVEVQALVARSTLPQPRRSAQGVDQGRLSLLLAVLERRAEVPVGSADVFVSAVGGVRLVDPGVDLGVALAVVSSAVDRWLPADLVVCGEIGLGGELRQATQTRRRLAEAARLGFRRAIVPSSAPTDIPGPGWSRPAPSPRRSGSPVWPVRAAPPRSAHGSGSDALVRPRPTAARVSRRHVVTVFERVGLGRPSRLGPCRTLVIAVWTRCITPFAR
ncbi:MAG: DNA repair protein RadA [Ilumatobacteraceae bacterium]